MVIVVVPLSARFVGANETETVGATATVATTVKEAEAAAPTPVKATVPPAADAVGAVVVLL
jgi:hypothetical protein